MSQESTPLLGNPQAQADFFKRNEVLIERLKNIQAACNAADIIGQMNKDDMVIYCLVRLVIEDFHEVMLLCANGMTTGAMKILRGMFERTVTACYLEKRPEEKEKFVNYWPVTQRKAARRVKEDLPGALPDEMHESIEASYEAVKELYRVPDCKKCQTTQINFSWTRKDIIAMAKAAGDFETVIHFAYYAPMTETHANMGAILRRVKFDETTNSFWYEYGVKPQEESNTLICANYLLLRALEVFRSKFELDALKGPIEQCASDYIEWLKSERDAEQN
jgi:hypothetical protein